MANQVVLLSLGPDEYLLVYPAQNSLICVKNENTLEGLKTTSLRQLVHFCSVGGWPGRTSPEVT